MEWLVLLLFVPAVVVPIVLLFGFAGCGAYLESGPEVPLIVSATPLDENTVEITWTYQSMAAASFELRRRKGSDAPSDPIAIDAPPFVDPGLEAATAYTYQLRARLLSNGDVSAWSSEAAIETWARAFTGNLEQTGTDRSVGGACVVQRLSGGTLSRRGNLVGLTLRAASDAQLVVSRVTISFPALLGDEFDSSAAPRDIVLTPVTVTAGWALRLPPIAFDVGVNETLLIAFDVSPGNARVADGVPHTAYLKQGPVGTQITEAGAQNRAGFTTRPNELWFIDAVDVATKWPPLT